MQLSDFEDLPLAVAYIDLLVWEAKENPSERKQKLKEARILANEYEEHCAKGGNHSKQFSI